MLNPFISGTVNAVRCLAMTIGVLIGSLYPGLILGTPAPQSEVAGDSLLTMARKVSNSALDSSLVLAKEALALSQAISDKELEGKCLEWIGYVLAEQGAYAESLRYLFQGEAVLEQIQSPHLAQVYNALGITYKYLHDFSRALTFQFQALETISQAGDSSFVSTIHNSIGNLYADIGDTVSARKYFSYAVQAATLRNDNVKLATYYINLSNLHRADAKQRMDYLSKAHTICVSYGLGRQLSYVFEGFAKSYLDLGQVDSALNYFQRSISWATNASDSVMSIHQSVQYHSVLAEHGDAALAQKELEELLLNTIVIDDLQLKQKCHSALSEAYRRLGLFEEALYALEESRDIGEMIRGKEIIRQSSISNAKYEVEQREVEIAQQQLEIERQRNIRNKILYIGGFILALSILISQLVVERQKRQKKEAELAFKFEKERANQMEILTKSKIDFFNNVSHELRTPLTMIIGPLQEAVKVVKNKQLKNHVDLALNNSLRLTNLVNEILDLSKLDAGKMKVQNSEAGLLIFLTRIIRSFSSLAASHGIIMDDNLDELNLQKLFINSDLGKIEQILNNLISNAIKFSQDGDRVDLILDQQKLDMNILQIAVRDEGVGISEEEQQLIFNRYYQSTVSGLTAGTGIGLALTKELCELLQGEIRVESKLGEGSKFTIMLPVALEVKESNRESATSAAELSSQSRLRARDEWPEVLIVEDDPAMAQYLKDILSKYYRCTISYNGRQALELVEKKDFDLITSDVMMPEMDGFEFRNRINQDPRRQNTPFIMLTARSLEEDKLKGFQLGVDDYLTKPFSAAELIARMNNLIKNKLARLREGENIEVSFEDNFLERAKQVVSDNIGNPHFKVPDLASRLNYSPRQLGRILRRITGLTPVEFILELRLQLAYELVRQGRFGSLGEVRDEIGIESASYFSSKFRERFGVNPSDVAIGSS